MALTNSAALGVSELEGRTERRDDVLAVPSRLSNLCLGVASGLLSFYMPIKTPEWKMRGKAQRKGGGGEMGNGRIVRGVGRVRDAL